MIVSPAGRRRRDGLPWRTRIDDQRERGARDYYCSISRSRCACLERVRQEMDLSVAVSCAPRSDRITPGPPYIRSNLDKRYIKVVSV